MNKLNIKMLHFLILTGFSMAIFAQDATVTVNQPEAINKLLEFKKDTRTVETFRIQIYSGDSSFRAKKVKSEFREKYGEWPTEMVFNTPNYKIWVGNFRSRLEADRALLRIKKNYINAFIFKPKKD
ncbi:MAG: SPOR domain-containing protein [Winogradskyella sp.]|uniref:SPOR domain-containing protein n=1 Tax=Winogradskyella sp. TaxID=1883156 RepID=UPI0017C560C6|nr:SPOR domain-containing protein [Winogradskyella sp.]MBT8244971.1 SPOR domain-containing protein [Winogradskyella sp.]NNK22187.1 SPOR domain-containing protein [Winogradskyella sp.]